MNIPSSFWKPELCVQFAAGQTILKEGESGDCLMVLLEGEVEVRIQNQVVGTFTPVEVLGEMAAIDRQPRSATVIAKTDCRLAQIDQARFLAAIKREPGFGIDIMRMLVDRIRWMDSVISKDEAKNVERLARMRTEVSELKVFFESQSDLIGQRLQRLRELNL